MMNSRACKVVTVLLVALSLSLSAAAEKLEPEFSIHVTPKTHVQVSNLFTDGSTATVECKSGDDGLGRHVVGVGQTYEFVFYPNIWFTTRYDCPITTPHGWYDFDAYRAKRDMKRCYKNCMWTVAENGVTGYTMLGAPDITYPWKKN